MSKFDQVCQDYAVSKYASAQDARIAMLEEIAALRAQRDELVEVARGFVSSLGCPSSPMRSRALAAQADIARAAISKATASAA